MMHVLRKSLIVVLAVALLSSCSQHDEEEYRNINQERISRGLPALSYDIAYQANVMDHTGKMIQAGGIYHSDLNRIQCGTCKHVGEIVGSGYSIGGVHAAFMASPTHRELILDPRFDTVTVGTIQRSDGAFFVSVMFIDY